MTTRIALVLFALIAALFIADAQFLDGNLPVFLGKKGVELLDYIAFWH